MFITVSPLFQYEMCRVEKGILIWGLVLPWLIKDSDIFYSLHLQLGFSLQKSGLFDFKIGNSNFYRKNPSSVHFRIYKWNFYFKNASCVNLKICNMNIYRKKIRVVCILKFATRIFTAKIRVVCISKITKPKNPLKYHQWINKYLLSVTGKRRLGQIDEFISRF